MADGWVVVLVQLLRCVWLFVTPWTAAFQASLSFTVSWSLLKFMSIESVKLSNHLIFCCLLLFPSIFPSSGSFPMTQLFTLGGQSIRVSASVLPKNIQSWFPLEEWPIWYPCSPRDSQESSPAPQFKSMDFFWAQPFL